MKPKWFSGHVGESAKNIDIKKDMVLADHFVFPSCGQIQVKSAMIGNARNRMCTVFVSVSAVAVCKHTGHRPKTKLV